MYRRCQGRGATGETMKWRTEEREPGPLEENSRGFTRCPDVYDFRDLFLYFTSGPAAYRRTILNLRPRRFFPHGKGTGRVADGWRFARGMGPRETKRGNALDAADVALSYSVIQARARATRRAHARWS